MPTEKKIATKYKVGQKIWHINNGFVECEEVKSIFENTWGDMLVAVHPPKFSEGRYSFHDGDVYAEDTVFPTKAALIKNLAEQENE